MKLDFDHLIQIVAERHRFILTKDDPIMAAVSLNEVVLDIHNQSLIQKMDEQNTKMLMALNAALNTSKADTRKEHLNFVETVNAIHQKHIREYRQIIENQSHHAKSLVLEADRNKKSSWLSMWLTVAIAAISIAANLLITVVR